MKSSKRSNRACKQSAPDKEAAEIATSGNFPLELVASTALHFFLNEDKRTDPACQKRAIDTAIWFLNLCSERIEFLSTIMTASYYVEKELRFHGWKFSDTVPYAEGIKFITGQKRLDRAQEHYEAYRKSNWQLKRPLTAAELTAALKRDEEEGFLARSLLLQRFVFETSRERGRLDLKPRKKIRKPS